LEKKVLPGRSKIYRKGREERKGQAGPLQKILGQVPLRPLRLCGEPLY
jgi:hypothetical protein